ncbi:CatB-related O-acetyltransferase [Paracoccaceae bacterium GXU_MW_L88]
MRKVVGKPPVKPKSIFTREDLDSFVPMTRPALMRGHHINGPFKRWTISGNVICGKYTTINGPFNARGIVRIGRYCAFGQSVSVLSGNHRTDMPCQQTWLHRRFGFEGNMVTTGPVEIGHNVWIGDKVNILSGVQVGHGAVLAAGATVTKSCGPFEIIGGVPGKVIGKRFTDNVIAQLLEIAWWGWSDEKIAANRVFFETHIPRDEDVDLLSLVV